MNLDDIYSDLTLPELPSLDQIHIEDADNFTLASSGTSLNFPCILLDAEIELSEYKVDILQQMSSTHSPSADIFLYTQAEDSTYLLGTITGRQAGLILNLVDSNHLRVFLSETRELYGAHRFALAS